MNDNNYLTVKFFNRWLKEFIYRFNHKPSPENRDRIMKFARRLDRDGLK